MAFRNGGNFSKQSAPFQSKDAKFDAIKFLLE